MKKTFRPSLKVVYFTQSLIEMKCPQCVNEVAVLWCSAPLGLWVCRTCFDVAIPSERTRIDPNIEALADLLLCLPIPSN